MSVAAPLGVAGAAVLVVAAAAGAGPVGVLLGAAALAVGALTAVALTERAAVAPLRRNLAAERRRADDLELQLVAERAERDLRDRFVRALDRSESEATTLRTTLRAVSELLPDADVALLLAAPDGPNVAWSVRLVDGRLGAAEPLASTPGCVALADGATAATAGSAALDACAHVRDPDLPDAQVAALCVPIALGDRSLGVVCVQTPPGELPDDHTTSVIECMVERCAARVTEQRLERGPSTAGTPDPLTGLPGPTALRGHLRDLVRSLSPFCVAVVDVDDDGAERDDAAVDDAVLLVAGSVRSTLRPDDLVCRLDRTRLAAVLTQCEADQAAAALERARESLVLTLAELDVADHVTFSAGVVESRRATSLDEIVELASGACRLANAAGGNRVTLAEG